MEPINKPNNINDHSLGPIEGSSRGLIVWAGLVILIPSVLIFIFSISPYTIQIAGYDLKKFQWGSGLEEITAEVTEQITEKDTASFQPFAISDSSTTLTMDSLNPTSISAGGFKVSTSLTPFFNPIFTDTTKHRVLLIGDSEAGGLRYPLNDYCLANGHKLVACVEWYSATVFNFAKADTIAKIIQRYKPTYVFVVMGLNELFAKDLKARSSAARLLAKKLRGIPYTWIGPANWEEDFGINDVFARAADTGTYFYTKQLVLPRAEDGRHPNNKGYRIWMDSLAGWINNSAKWRIPLKTPTKRARPLRADIIMMNAAKFRGY